MESSDKKNPMDAEARSRHRKNLLCLGVIIAVLMLLCTWIFSSIIGHEMRTISQEMELRNNSEEAVILPDTATIEASETTR